MKKIPHYDPTNDLVFKFVFGRESRKNVTLRFINDTTGRDGKDAFVDLDFQSTERVPEKKEEKLGRLDVFGVLDNGARVDIEMQVINHFNMEKRVLFYWAHMYLHHDALKKGEPYRSIKPALSINILRFPFLPTKEPFSRYGIYNVKNEHRLTDDLEIDFLEIPKYKDKPVKKMTKMERWLAYFANRLDTEQRKELAMETPEIAEAMEASEEFFLNDKSYWDYLQRESAIRDYNNDILSSRAEGRKEGEYERTVQIIRNLLKMGKAYEEIAQATDMSVEEVRQIAETVFKKI